MKSIKFIFIIILVISFVFNIGLYNISAASNDVIIVDTSSNDNTEEDSGENSDNSRIVPGSAEDTTTYRAPDSSDIDTEVQENTEEQEPQTEEENEEEQNQQTNESDETTQNLQEYESVDDIISGKNISMDILNQIVQYNTQSTKKETLETSQVDLEYITKYQSNETLPQNVIQVVKEGEVGLQEVILKRVYENDEVVEEQEISAATIKSASNRIVQIGTADVTSTYEVKVGDRLYVTTDLLPIRTEPSDDASKLISISRGQGVEVQEIQGAWLKVNYNNTIGWSKAECLTFFNENNDYSEYIKDPLKVITREEAIGSLDFNMNLAQPSGLSYDQFIRVLSNNSLDTQGVIASNAQYFYIIEQQYNINGIFVASMAVHESNWGTSNMANNKKNLFGYGAYDSSAYNSAYNFSDYSESIDLLARVFVKYYLNPSGTKIYDGNLASGKYYNGPTLSGVNKKYATDKNWANAVYNHMSNLYNKL